MGGGDREGCGCSEAGREPASFPAAPDLETESLPLALRAPACFTEGAQTTSIEAIWIQKFKYSHLNRSHYYVCESEL